MSMILSVDVAVFPTMLKATKIQLLRDFCGLRIIGKPGKEISLICAFVNDTVPLKREKNCYQLINRAERTLPFRTKPFRRPETIDFSSNKKRFEHI